MTFFAAIKKAEGPIPELRPPKGHIAFDVPEAAILNGALLIAFLVLVFGRILRSQQPRPLKPIEPAIVLARRALQSAGGPTVVEDCVQIVRRYLANAFGLGPEGATTSELCAAFAAHPNATQESLDALHAFFAECELARFAPLEIAQLRDACLGRTAELLETLETRRVTLAPPPLPVAS